MEGTVVPGISPKTARGPTMVKYKHVFFIYMLRILSNAQLLLIADR